jgi:release factor glutamine methyltransferase
MRLQTALRQGSELLERAGIHEPKLTAEVLLCHALRRERSFLYAHPEHELDTLEWLHYGRYLHERLQGKPTQYITRTQEFYGRPFRVSSDVLIPRPETEHVVERVLEISTAPLRAVDIGCGSGAIAATLSLEWGCPVFATDLSLAALRVAGYNARSLGAQVELVCCDLGSALPAASFDLVASNPPYVPDPEIVTLQREVREFEPLVALSGGPTGVEIYHRLVPEAARLLRPGGWLVMEIGYRAEETIRALLDERWEAPHLLQDLAGWPRVLSARLRTGAAEACHNGR